MPFIRIELDPETAERLQDLALAERRPTAWQAEVLPRKALGLPFPWPIPGTGETPEMPYGRE
jgi:hypothetical protein